MKTKEVVKVLLAMMTIIFFSGCAGQKDTLRHGGIPPDKKEAYGSYTPTEVEEVARRVLVSNIPQQEKHGLKMPCPPNTAVDLRRSDYIHLGRNPVDPSRGYISGQEITVRLSGDYKLRVEQKGGKWVTGVVPKGTVLVALSTGEVLRICSCANGVSLTDGKTIYVDLPKSSLKVETLAHREVTSTEATLRARVVSKDQAIAWFVYWGEGSDSKFATRPQYIEGEVSLVESTVTELEGNSKYFYQGVAVNTLGRGEGDVFWLLTDRNCVGKGTIASGTGGFLLTFGLVNISNPIGWGSLALGTGLSAYSLVEKDSDPTCKAVAGLLGGTAGAISGMSYRNVHQSSGNVSSGEQGPNPPNGPAPNPPTGPGPSPPNGPAPTPGN